MDMNVWDLRDQRGRAQRLATAFVLAIAIGFGCSRFATILPAGPYDRPVAREWFILAAGIFAWLISFLGALGYQNTRAKQRWYASRLAGPGAIS